MTQNLVLVFFFADSLAFPLFRAKPTRFLGGGGEAGRGVDVFCGLVPVGEGRGGHAVEPVPSTGVLA